MRGLARWPFLGTLIAVAAAFAACAGVGPYATPAWPVVPISDIKSVAGRWEGLIQREPGGERDDFIQVTIKDDGTYQAAAYRVIGALERTGKLSLQSGKLTASTDTGSATYTLYAGGGRRILRVEGGTRDSSLKFYGNLRPSK
ncbi:MAG TPA: hypothetical protein VFN71_02075 [Methylomirabilota bacterium]|nr:hypothetical protein [Methylomirabilota bacterium]